MNAPRPPAQARENAEPSERSHPIPLWIAAVSTALVLFGAGYLLFSEGFGPAELGDRRTVADLSGRAGATGSNAASTSAVDGQQLYATHCVACHQATGQGLPGVFPPLAGSEWVTGDARVLAHILLFGVSGPIEVMGQTYQGQMPAFAHLSNAELAAVASHIRATWSNQAKPLSVETLDKARQSARTTPYQGGDELKRLAAQADASAP
jgi:mono/diheme cytochrome c family protein